MGTVAESVSLRVSASTLGQKASPDLQFHGQRAQEPVKEKVRWLTPPPGVYLYLLVHHPSVGCSLKNVNKMAPLVKREPQHGRQPPRTMSGRWEPMTSLARGSQTALLLNDLGTSCT